MNQPLPPLDFNDSQLKENPYPIYKQYREQQPVFWSESSQAWVFMRYSDVQDLLNDPRTSVKRSQSFLERSPESRRAAIKPVVDVISRWLGVLDGSEHTHVRKLFSHGFTHLVMDNLAPTIRSATSDLLDNVNNPHQFDASAEFAYQLPIRILAKMLCIPPTEQEQFKQWSADIHAFLSSVPITEEVCDRVVNSMLALIDHLKSIVAERRQRPDDEFLSFLVQAEEAGDVLSAEYLLANLVFLLVAGDEPVGHLISNTIHQVLHHPNVLQQGLADSSRWKRIIEESIRYDAPFQIATRITSEPISFGDITIDKGQFLFLMLGSANHDEAHYTNADEFDIDREVVQSLSFGSGPHYCLGQSLARLEATIALELFFKRFPNAQLSSTQAKQWIDTARFRGLRSLPVVVN